MRKLAVLCGCSAALIVDTLPREPSIVKSALLWSPQGPFRNINEVLEQRYKPLEPTLRATHSVDGLQQARKELRKQEWVHNISDKM